MSEVKKEKNSRLILYILFILTFSISSFWSYLSPLWADDYSVERMGFFKIIDECVKDYFRWNGRFFGQFFFKMLVNINPVAFGILNGLMFFMLTYFIFIFSKNKYENYKNLLIRYIFIITILFLFTPSFAQVYLWRSVAGNYLWTTTIILLFMYLMIENLKITKKRNNFIFIFFLSILGFISGLSNENTAGGMIVILAIYLLQNRINKIKLIPLFFSIVGYLLLLLSPGSKIRYNSHADFANYSILKKLSLNIPVTNDFIISQLSLILVIFLILFSYNYILVKKINVDSIVWFISGILVFYALDFSPEGAGLGRASFGGFIFITIGISKLLILGNSEKIIRFINTLLLCLLIIFSVINFSSGFIDSIKSYQSVNEQNFKIVQQSKRNDIVRIDGLEYIGKTKYSFADENLLSSDPNGWANICYKEGFKVKEIILE